MQRIPSIAIAAIGLLCPTGIPAALAGEADAAAPSAPVARDAGQARPARRPLYSPQEITRMREQLIADQQRREAFRTPHPELPFVELAPFVVLGDDTLLLAAIRREIDLGPESIRRRVAEVAPVLSRRALLSARASESVFRQPTPGGPADRTSVGLVSSARLRQALREPIVKIFAAPGTAP